MKKVGILIGIAVIYVAVTLFVFLILPGIISTTIVLGSNVRWQYKNHEWTEYDSKANLYGFKVYDPRTGNLEGSYDIRYVSNKWYVTQKDDYNLYNKSMLGVKSNKLSVYGYDIVYPSSRNDINKLVTKAGIKNSGELTILYQVTIDLNGDGNSEVLYGISNMDETVENQFFILGLVMDNDYYIIKKNTGKMVPSISIYAIIDIDGDSNLELILEDSGYSMTNSRYSLYSSVNGEYTEMISTGGSL